LIEAGNARRRQLVTSRRMRRGILLLALVALAMAIIAFVAEVLDVFDYLGRHAMTKRLDFIHRSAWSQRSSRK
jgi:hypothetical protein